MKLRTAVLDDEPLAVELLADYISKSENLQLIEASTDAFKVLKMVQAKEIDLLFLDIQMPDLTGLQFMKIAGDNCKVILTTAYSEYALDGYEFNVVDYLLKPFSFERFTKAVEKVKPQLDLTENEVAAKADHLFIKSEYKLIRLNYADILYIESLRDYIGIHTNAKQKIMSLETLRNMEAQLPENEFVRVHKSYIVSLKKISVIEKTRLIINEVTIPIGDSYRENFFKKINTLSD